MKPARCCHATAKLLSEEEDQSAKGCVLLMVSRPFDWLYYEWSHGPCGFFLLQALHGSSRVARQAKRTDFNLPMNKTKTETNEKKPSERRRCAARIGVPLPGQTKEISGAASVTRPMWSAETSTLGRLMLRACFFLHFWGNGPLISTIFSVSIAEVDLLQACLELLGSRLPAWLPLFQPGFLLRHFRLTTFMYGTL